MREGNLNINDEPDVEQYIGLEEAKESDCPGNECNDGDSCDGHSTDDCGYFECVDGCCTAMCDSKTPGTKGNNSVMKSIKEEIMKIKTYKRLINEWINHPCEGALDPILACEECCNSGAGDAQECCDAADAMHTIGPIDGPGSSEIGIDMDYELEPKGGTGKYTWVECCEDYKKGKGRGHKECCDKIENEGGRVRDMREGRRRLSEAAMCWTDNDCQAGEYCNRNGADLSSDGKTGRCRKGGGMSTQDGGGRGVPDYDYIDHEDRDEYDGRKSRVVGVDSNIKKQRRLSEGPYCPGGCPDGCSCEHHGLYGRCDCGDLMGHSMPWDKVADGGDDDDTMKKHRELREFHEYSKNRTNIERFLNEKEDKEMGTPDPKKVLAIAKKVLTGGNPPSTGMNNWWCCLLACPDPGCKGDRWEVVMHPWG
jgi:hypothetical protein